MTIGHVLFVWFCSLLVACAISGRQRLSAVLMILSAVCFTAAYIFR
jgi:hypothetical protein